MDWASLSSYVGSYMVIFAAGFASGAAHAWVRRILSAV